MSNIHKSFSEIMEKSFSDIVQSVKDAQSIINDSGVSEYARECAKTTAYDEIVAILGLEGWGEENE